MGKAGHREVVGLRSDVGASVGVGVPLLLLVWKWYVQHALTERGDRRWGLFAHNFT